MKEVILKICQPAETEQGINTVLHGHFRSAPRYIVFDTETHESQSLGNQRKKGESDLCGSLSSLSDLSVDVAIVGGVGKCALSKMHSCGIKVYRAVTHRLDGNIESLRNGELTELTYRNTRRGNPC